MKEWYEFYMADEERKQILHQLGAKLQEAKNQNPIQLHQLGAEIVSADKTFDFQNYSCYFCITKHKTTKSNK